ncbi:MAG: hypothetical protein WC985_01445 [Thermoplasmata archaeon]
MERLNRGLALAIVLVLTLGGLFLPFLPQGDAPSVPRVPASLAAPAGPQPMDAVLSASMTATPTSASPKDTVVFTLTFVNGGDQAAPRVWINDTLPSRFVYVSDTAASAGSTTPFPRYTFSSVGVGSHSFQISVRVAIGVPPGTWSTNVASVTYTNTTNAVRPPLSISATVVIGLAAKQLHLTTTFGLTPTAPTSNLVLPGVLLKKGDPPLSWDLSPVLALSFQAVNLNAVLYLDSPSGSTQTYLINATVWDRNGASFVFVASTQQSIQSDSISGYQRFAFPVALAANYTFLAGHEVRLSLRVVNSGSTDDALLAMNATSVDSRLEVLTSTYVEVTTLSLQDAGGTPSFWSPKDSLVVRATVQDPFGSYDIAGARINITAPSGSVVVGYVNMTLLQTDGANPSGWKLYETTLSAPLDNGTYAVEVVGIEGNGVVDVASGTATVRAPLFTLEKTASVAQAKQNTRFTYTIWFNNTGTGPAGRVWINDTMPSQVNWQSSPNATVVPGTPIWAFSNVAVGSHWVSFDVRVSGSVVGVAFILNTVSLNYSDEKGYLWPMRLATRDVILNGPVISVTLSSNPAASVHSNETVVYTIGLTNTGDAAQTIWFNLTLSVGLSYVSDTHNPAWGSVSSTGGAVDFTFFNMPTGSPTPVTWSFTLSARAGAGLVRGSVLTLTAGLNDTSANGILMPSRIATLALTVVSPWISAATLSSSSATAVPGDLLTIYVNETNVGNEVARTAWINLTIDADLTFVGASVPATATNGIVRLTIANLRIGAWTVYVNVSVILSSLDRHLLTVNGSLEYVDGVGNALPALVLAPASSSVTLPRLALGVSPSIATLEAGTPTALIVTLTNTGSGSAGDLWLNLSLPGGLQYLSDTSGGTRTVVGSSYLWHWQAFAPGTHAFTLNLLAAPSVQDRTNADLVFHVDDTDGNGNPQAPLTSNVRLSFVAPTIVLTLSQDVEQAQPGGTFSYRIQVRNLGSTTARYVNVSDPVDARLEVVSSDASVPATGSLRLSWNFTDLQPGGTENITLVVRVPEGTAARSLIANTVEARYSNSVGTPIGYRSQAVFLTVAVDLMPIAYILLGGAALGFVVVYLVYRRNRVRIEEVFLVYRDGILISHLSRTMVEEKDRDVLSGMLTVVQDFVKDAFQYGEHRELHQMEFGDYRILIERGKHVYLAVVYRGRDSSMIRKKVRSVLDSVEDTYGKVLQSWDGSMESVVGTRDILRDRLLVGRLSLFRSKGA